MEGLRVSVKGTGLKRHAEGESLSAYGADFGGKMEGLSDENTVYFDINAGK